MSDNESEIQIMNDRINSLESTIVRGVEASEKVSTSVNELLLEFKERDIRHEYEKVANEQLGVKVAELNTTITDFITIKEPVLARAKKVQDRWDNLFLSMGTTTGKVIIGILIMGAMVMLGLDPRNLLTKP